MSISQNEFKKKNRRRRAECATATKPDGLQAMCDARGQEIVFTTIELIAVRSRDYNTTCDPSNWLPLSQMGMGNVLQNRRPSKAKTSLSRNSYSTSGAAIGNASQTVETTETLWLRRRRRSCRGKEATVYLLFLDSRSTRVLGLGAAVAPPTSDGEKNYFSVNLIS